tara:strand:+ start:955 stop:1161 length:207 start_codon:yes stop_codon:yes gene_type:complete
MPKGNPGGYPKPYTIYSDNPKMDNSGWDSEPDLTATEITVKQVGPITKYKSGGVVYTDKNDEDTIEDM